MLRARLVGSGIAADVVRRSSRRSRVGGQLAQVRRLGFLGRIVTRIGGDSTGAARLAGWLGRADRAFVGALDFRGCRADRLVGTVCGHRCVLSAGSRR